jgi:hypothetical protein
MTDATFAEWVILELLGHRRAAGYLTEQQIAGASFLRLDIPGDDTKTPTTQIYNPTSVYAIHPTTEDVARHLAKTHRAEPVYRWQLPAAPQTPADIDIDVDEDEDEFVDEDGGPF